MVSFSYVRQVAGVVLMVSGILTGCARSTYDAIPEPEVEKLLVGKWQLNDFTFAFGGEPLQQEAIKAALEVKNIEFTPTHLVVVTYENGSTEEGDWRLTTLPVSKFDTHITFPIRNTSFTFGIEQLTATRLVGKCSFKDDNGNGNINLELSR